jgi:hypothetical protein
MLLSTIFWLCLLQQSPVAEDLLHQSPLSDTGQKIRYSHTFGEDADFAGRGPAFTDNQDGTVTDQITGLIWQQSDGGEMTFESAKDYASALNLAGQSDWRLPNSAELLSIMDHGRHGPAMNTEFFTRSEARYWWTHTARADDSSKVWVVNTGGGIGAHAKLESLSAGGDRPIHVRCVRGASLFATEPILQRSENGMVTDIQTGLIWQVAAPEQRMTWESALEYCSQLRLGGHTDWRLPNIRELRSLSNDQFVSPSLDPTFFSNARADACWSSTTQANTPSRAWYVDFRYGLVTYSEKIELLHVRAVRGGVAVPGERSKPVPDIPLATDQKGRSDRNKQPAKKSRSSQPRNKRPPKAEQASATTLQPPPRLLEE